MKKTILTLMLAITMLFTITTTNVFADGSKKDFKDVRPTHWAYNDIMQMVEKGYLKGVGNNQFLPEKEVSYAEFIQMMANLFYDVPFKQGKDWWKNAYSYLNDRNITRLTTVEKNITYSINDSCTRVDMATIIFNIATYDKDRLRKLPKAPENAFEKDNVNEYFLFIGNYYRDGDYMNAPSVKYCYDYGFLKGMDSTGAFKGTSAMTRAQAAAIMNRLYNADTIKEKKQVTETNTVKNEAAVKPTKPINNIKTTDAKSLYPQLVKKQSAPIKRKLKDYLTVDTNMDLSARFPDVRRQEYANNPRKYYINVTLSDDWVYTPGYLGNGMPNTPENIIALYKELEELIPEGTYWSDGVGAPEGMYLSGKNFKISPIRKEVSGASACNGYAALSFDVIHGKFAPIKRIYSDIKNTQPGEVLVSNDANGELEHVSTVLDIKYMDDGVEGVVPYFVTADGNAGSQTSSFSPAPSHYIDSVVDLQKSYRVAVSE